MGTPAPPPAPLATHLASLGTGTNLSGKNMFKLTTDENPLNIIQFEYQILEQEDNYSGGYIYMSDVSFIQNGTNYEYSVPVPADQPGVNYEVNPNKQIRFRYWTQGPSTILASEWSDGYLKFVNAPIKPEFSNSFVLYRDQSNNDDDFLILELSESSRTAYTNPNNEDGVNLANGPIKFLVVYGFQDNLGNEVWKASPLIQPSINGSVRVELNDDVLSGSQVDVSVFAVYEFFDVEESGPFYTISEISDMMTSVPPSTDDLEPSLNLFNYVVNVLSTNEAALLQGTSSLYDVDNKMVELTWTSPASDVVNPVNHYEVQAKVVAGDNLFVSILNNIDASSRGYRLSEATVVAALQAEGQLPAGVSPSYGSKLEYRVVAKYPEDVNSSSTPQEVTVGKLPDVLLSDAITVNSHFAKTTNELVYSASYDISAILNNLSSQVSNATAIQIQLVRVPKNGDPSEVLTTDRIDLSLPQTLYRQRVVYDVGSNVTLFENITENDFQIVAWVVNDIASNKEIYLDSSLDPNNVLSQTVPAGWNEVTKSTTLSSKGLIFNLTVDNENKLFHFIALHREPLENVVVTKVDAEGGLVQGKPLTAETFNVRRVENDNLYLESNAPQELLNRLEHTYSGSYLTRVEGIFSVLFDNVDVPSTFSVAYANGNRLTTGFVNNNVFGGLTVSDEDMLTWEGSAP